MAISPPNCPLIRQTTTLPGKNRTAKARVGDDDDDEVMVVVEAWPVEHGELPSSSGRVELVEGWRQQGGRERENARKK
ncbi:hypothetical protein E2562_028593 [Oryza meyeriana var. granulata]|uniref:DUF834 domain-containing protein n=1 Tax=Oryza meyeriana var. granulata TaxID=110450 RepID=A0A6G1D8M6_9ORYZ|nr:hypothetical protein E2562_028593 [Oryza meyeriana var. granulata]